MRVLDDFKCEECGKVKEIMHDNSAGSIWFCDCGGRMVKQFAAGQNFRFYGEGTYLQHQKGD
jgi:predicted nucleic acid-binding Zn ribbon protein